jgi:hypothetical protein
MDVDSPLRYPLIGGYRIGEEIGGGGFSKWVDAVRLSTFPNPDCTNCAADPDAESFEPSTTPSPA